VNKPKFEDEHKYQPSGFPVEKHHHEGHEDHEEKQFKHKERKVENQKTSKAFVLLWYYYG
jgi:hypothetical protein